GPTACSIASRAVRPVRPAARSVELAGAEALAPVPSVPGGKPRAARVPARQPTHPQVPTAALRRSWSGMASRTLAKSRRLAAIRRYGGWLTVTGRGSSAHHLGDGMLRLLGRELLAVLGRQLVDEALPGERLVLQVALGRLDRLGVPVDRALGLQVGHRLLGDLGRVLLAVLRRQLTDEALPAERHGVQVALGGADRVVQLRVARGGLGGLGARAGGGRGVLQLVERACAQAPEGQGGGEGELEGLVHGGAVAPLLPLGGYGDQGAAMAS